MVGHHREQRLTFDDVVHRLGTDRTRYADSTFDIRDIIADEDKFAIRFICTALVNTTRQTFTTEVTYFYQPKEGNTSPRKVRSPNFGCCPTRISTLCCR